MVAKAGTINCAAGSRWRIVNYFDPVEFWDAAMGVPGFLYSIN
jgi:hypothetical protein